MDHNKSSEPFAASYIWRHGNAWPFVAGYEGFRKPHGSPSVIDLLGSPNQGCLAWRDATQIMCRKMQVNFSF